MARLFFFLPFINFLSANLLSQNPVGNIYGMYWNGTAECLATVNQQNGTATSIGSIPNIHLFWSTGGQATFDDDSSRYIFLGIDFTGRQRIYTVNACNAQLIYDPYSPPNLPDTLDNFMFIHYSSATKKIYAICFDASLNARFGTINQYNGLFTSINIIPGLSTGTGLGYFGNPFTFLPDSNLYVFNGQDLSLQRRIYTIDVSTGKLRYPPPLITINPRDLEYDTLTKTIYGVYNNGSVAEYVSVNRLNGAFNIINSIAGFQYPASTIGGGDTAIFNTCAFNTDSNQYVAVSTIAPGATSNNIYTLNPITGNILNKPFLMNETNWREFKYGHVPYFKPKFSSGATVCSGTQVTLSATGGKSYLWNNGATDSSIIVTPKNTTTYGITVFNTFGCSVIDSITVVVPLSTATVQGATSICKGNSTSLSVSGSGISSYSWNTGSTSSSISISPDSTTAYSVMVTNGICKDTITISKNVIVNPLPVPLISSKTHTCAGSSMGSADVSVKGGMPSYSYIWSNGQNTQNAINLSGGVYTITVTDQNGCSDTTSVKIATLPSPIILFSGDTAICSGQSTTLSASGGGLYKWNTGDTTGSIIVQPVTQTTFSVTVTGINGCSVTSSQAISVNPLPVGKINGLNTICVGDSIKLTVSGGTSYVWNTGDTSALITVSPSDTTMYSVTVSTKGCKGVGSTSKTVNVNPLPVPSITGANSICITQSTTLSAFGGQIYIWNTGAASQTISVSPTANTSYSVAVYKNGCASDTSLLVIVNPIPVVSIAGGGAVVEGKSTQLTATGGMSSYSWTPVTGLSCVDCFNPIASPELNTNYCVTVIDSSNCSNEACTEIDVTCGEVFIPSAFSPNGDGQNDVLYVRGKCIQSFSFLVFDRWGEKVFESENLAHGWDGRFNNQLCSSGAYAFYLKGTLFDGSNVTKMGSVILVR